jgi:hypothetical protein
VRRGASALWGVYAYASGSLVCDRRESARESGGTDGETDSRPLLPLSISFETGLEGARQRSVTEVPAALMNVSVSISL